MIYCIGSRCRPKIVRTKVSKIKGRRSFALFAFAFRRHIQNINKFSLVSQVASMSGFSQVLRETAW
jgi:hypothetical protein